MIPPVIETHAQEVFTLPEGTIVIVYPKHMTPESLSEMRTLFDLVVRKAERWSRKDVAADTAAERSGT